MHDKIRSPIAGWKTMSMSSSPTTRRIDLKGLVQFLLHPRQVFEAILGQKKPAWLTPMLTLSLTLLLSTIVTGFLRARSAAMGEVSLPVDWQWWSSEMQNNYMQAVQATQSPVFLYIIPAIIGLVGLWLGWGILSGLLHLASTLLGGRGSLSSALNIVSWGTLPLALRDILRIVYMLFAGHPIRSAGLSGFITGSEGGVLFLANLFESLDIFLVWQILLLVLGLSILDNLPRGKAVAGVIVVILISLLATAGLGTLSASLGGMMVTRPFF
jgi:hypothetical protein